MPTFAAAVGPFNEPSVRRRPGRRDPPLELLLATFLLVAIALVPAFAPSVIPQTLALPQPAQPFSGAPSGARETVMPISSTSSSSAPAASAVSSGLASLPGPLTWSSFLPENQIPIRAFTAATSFTAEGNGFAEIVGGTGACGVYCNDSWQLSLNDPAGPTWFPGAAPGNEGMLGASMAYDAADNQVVLFGGFNGTTGALGQTWTEVPYKTSWVGGGTGPAPQARWSAAMAYDPVLGGVVLFGGDGRGGLLSDTWLFREGNWTPVSSSLSPPARSGASLVWQAPSQRLILFGGNGSFGPLSDTWAFSGGSWYPLHSTVSPPARTNASAWTDGEGDPLVGMGRGPSQWLNDLWILTGDNWTEPPTASSLPEPVAGATMVPNLGATPNDLVLLWGENATGVQRDTWSLRVANGGSPPAPTPLTVQTGVVPSAGRSPLTVNLTAYGEGGTPPYTYQWNFGDGSAPSVVGSPVHTYARPGSYLASVLVKDSAVPPQTSTTDLPVQVFAPPGVFNATAVASPTSGSVPLDVAFLTTTSGGTPPLSYTWDFGDGAPLSHAIDPSHLYNTSGSFAAVLTVNESAGARAIWVDTIVVRGTGLSVALTSVPSNGTVPLTVAFHAAVRGGPSPYHFLWTFGDGNSTAGSTANVTNQYGAPGTYLAQVTVIDSLGEHASAATQVTVHPIPPFVPPPPTLLQRIAGAVVRGAEFLFQPVVIGPILAVLIVAAVVRWGSVELPLVRAVRRGAGRRKNSERWGVAEVALLVRELRRGSSLRRIRRKLRPLLLRDARKAANRLAWKPGPDATWALRRALLLPPQLLLAGTALFLGLFLLPNCDIGPPVHPSCPVGVGAFFQTFGAFLVSLFTSWSTDTYLQAYLPYSLQLMAVVVGLSALLAYPLGLLAGWYRGRLIDQSTRAASALAFSIPIFVVTLLTLGAVWTWYFSVTSGDVLLGSLPTVPWLIDNMGGFPPWIALHENTLPTGFVLIDAPLHGAWAFEEVVLLKMLIQGLPIAAVYAAIFLRYARLATEEASMDPSLVGGKARGLDERRLLWTHTSRRVSPIYVSIFSTTFPTLLFVQMVAEWFYGDLGIGQSFLVSLGDPAELARVAFVVLVLIFAVNFVGDAVARLLDPSGRSRVRSA